jgi:hypothetical protein
VTWQISMTTRKELVAPLQLRHSSASFGDRIKSVPYAGTPERNRLYDEAVRQTLIVS